MRLVRCISLSRPNLVIWCVISLTWSCRNKFLLDQLKFSFFLQLYLLHLLGFLLLGSFHILFDCLQSSFTLSFIPLLVICLGECAGYTRLLNMFWLVASLSVLVSLPSSDTILNHCGSFKLLLLDHVFHLLLLFVDLKLDFFRVFLLLTVKAIEALFGVGPTHLFPAVIH